MCSQKKWHPGARLVMRRVSKTAFHHQLIASSRRRDPWRSAFRPVPSPGLTHHQSSFSQGVKPINISSTIMPASRPNLVAITAGSDDDLASTLIDITYLDADGAWLRFSRLILLCAGVSWRSYPVKFVGSVADGVRKQHDSAWRGIVRHQIKPVVQIRRFLQYPGLERQRLHS